MTDPAAPAPSVRDRLRRLWRIWTPIAVVALFGGFGGPPGWVPLFQVVAVLAATVPLVRGFRLVEAAGLPATTAAQLRRLLWGLSLPLYAAVVVLFFAR